MSGRSYYRRLIGRRILRSFVKDREGVTAVEFSMIALPFFIIVFGIMEIGIAMFVNRLVDNALISASRLIRTGQHVEISSNEEFKTKICSFMPAFMCDTDRITVAVETANTFSEASESAKLYDEDGDLKDDGLAHTPGGAGDIVVVKLIYRWPMMTSALNLALNDNGTERNLTSTMVFRNEPWE